MSFLIGVYIGGVIVAAILTRLMIMQSQSQEYGLTNTGRLLFVAAWPVFVVILLIKRKEYYD